MFDQPSRIPRGMTSRPFDARFPGLCEKCGEGFDIGESIMYEGEDLVHADPDACLLFRDRPIQKPCTKCFLVHAGDCF
jgi:hypothetical protein